MKKGVFLFFLMLILGACMNSRTLFRKYDIVCTDSCFAEENGFFIKKYVIGDRLFSVQIEEATRRGDVFRLKGIVFDNVCNEGAPYPYLCLVSVDGSKYKIDKELCRGDSSGKFDCVFKWDIPKEDLRIVIDALGYHGMVYDIKPQP